MLKYEMYYACDLIVLTLLFQTALSIFFQEAAIPPCAQGPGTHFGQVSAPVFLSNIVVAFIYFSSMT